MSVRERMSAEANGLPAQARDPETPPTTAPGSLLPPSAREVALRDAVARLRDANQILAARTERLKETLALTRNRYRQVVEARGMLRDRALRLAERVRQLEASHLRERETSAKLRHKLAGLEQQLALALCQRRQDRRQGCLDPNEHNTPAGMDRFYADAANLRHFEDEVYRELAAALRRQIESEGISLDGRSVADFGCGVGQMLELVVDGTTPAQLVGLDYSEAALRAARARLPEASLLRHDIYEDFGRCFDVVLCTETLEHLAQPRRGLCAVLRCLAVGGVGIVTVPDGRSDVSLSHINFWSPESWPVFVGEVVTELAAAGIELRQRCEPLHIGMARIAYNCAVFRRLS